MNNIKSTVFIHLLIGVTLGVGNVNGLRCYVCGENEEHSCQDFNTSDSYIQECEPPYDQGCETETEDRKVVKRTCNNARANQCNVVNHILYCFCSTELCNDNITVTQNSYHKPTKFVSLSDDEDLAEGSGTKTSTISEKPNIMVKIRSAGSVIHVSLFLYLISFIFFLIIE